MSAFISALGQIWDFLISTMSQIFALYTTAPVLVAVLALWVLDRVFGIFDLIKG